MVCLLSRQNIKSKPMKRGLILARLLSYIVRCHKVIDVANLAEVTRLMHLRTNIDQTDLNRILGRFSEDYHQSLMHVSSNSWLSRSGMGTPLSFRSVA